MVITIMSFAVGVGNVEGFLISEIMPVYAKDTLASIGQPLNWIANLTVSTLFPIVFQAIGRTTYLLFVGTPPAQPPPARRPALAVRQTTARPPLTTHRPPPVTRRAPPPPRRASTA